MGSEPVALLDKPTIGLNAAAAHKTRTPGADAEAPVISESSVIVDATPAQGWELVADLRSWPAWTPDYEVLELDVMAPGAAFRWRLGKVKIKARFAVVAPERELTWSGRVFGYKAIDQQVLEASPAAVPG
ncbi:SRPBCC family protein [Nonomuraea sp. NPDC049141]|uniref:SRPBCC family protein n=1 Tax=Nonomuraea sp. NPDC049141 TaxID=3155500 RepID=UPI0033F7D8A9